MTARGAVATLLFASGACALLLEVLWPRVLALVVGGTARAEALVLAGIFVGLALGAALGGRLARAATAGALWRRWAACEAAAAAFALLPLAIGSLPPSAWLGPLAALSLIAPAAAAGAAWPLAVALSGARGRAVATLYAFATGGGLFGAALGAFVLAEHVGVRGGIALASLSNLAVAGAALARARRAGDVAVEPAPLDAALDVPVIAGRWPWVAGVASGLVVLAAETLHARLLASRLPHTAYAFSAVLVTWLLAMTAGAFLGRSVARAGAAGLGRLLAGAALALALGAQLATRRGPVEDAAGFGEELARLALEMLLVVAPAALLVGAVYPAAAALVARAGDAPARALGRLAALNAVAALLGAVLVPRLLLPTLGPGGALAALAVLVAVLAAAFLRSSPQAAVGALVLVTAVAVLTPARPEPLLLAGERVIDHRDGPGASVAVLEDARGERRLVADGRYTLGDSLSRPVARSLALLPMLLHPPRRVLLVGLGTGLTAGGACDAAPGAVVAAELLPEAEGLRAHFARWQGSRAADLEVVVDDGRLVLARRPGEFDLVVLDLVVPWHASTGLLWGVESLERARAALAEGGVLAAWLPLHQTSREGLVRTMAAFAHVFPDARAYAGSLDPARPLLLLISAGPDADVEPARARLAAGGVLDPLLAAPGADEGLELGPLAPNLPAIADALDVARRDPVRGDDVRLELEGSRARARDDHVTGERFRALVAAFDGARGELPPSARAVRSAWSGGPALAAIGRLHLARAAEVEGDERALWLLPACRALRASAPGEALDAIESLLPPRVEGERWAAVVVEGAQLALSRREPARALALVERLHAPPVVAVVLAAVAEDALGRRDPARARLRSVLATDEAETRRVLGGLGLQEWSRSMLGD